MKKIFLGTIYGQNLFCEIDDMIYTKELENQIKEILVEAFKRYAYPEIDKELADKIGIKTITISAGET